MATGGAVPPNKSGKRAAPKDSTQASARQGKLAREDVDSNGNTWIEVAQDQGHPGDACRGAA
jgi:hypothetical protein